MDRISLRKGIVSNTASTIDNYLEEVAHAKEHADPEERSLIAQLCAESINLFRAILRRLERDKTDARAEEVHTSLQRSLGRLILWSDGYGIATGRLDEVFSTSQDVRRATQKIIVSISRTLVESTLPPAQEFTLARVRGLWPS